MSRLLMLKKKKLRYAENVEMCITKIDDVQKKNSFNLSEWIKTDKFLVFMLK